MSKKGEKQMNNNNKESITNENAYPKCVQLPYEYPQFANTQGAAAAPIAMTGHPNAYNQILNQAVTLGCSRNFLTGFT